MDIIGIKITPKFKINFGKEHNKGQGGDGGKASVSGNGTAIGGRGGQGGINGKGGDGGDAFVNGDGFAMGGEGGEAAQLDRPAKGGRSPLEILGIPNLQLPDGTHLWDYGSGGDGTPQVTKRPKAKLSK